jgi:hypothetical protein
MTSKTATKRRNRSKKTSSENLSQSLNKLAVALKPKQKPSFKVNVQRSLISPARYLQALKDPFSEISSGVKVPDFDGNPSFTLASKDVAQFTTDAAGYAGGVIVYGGPTRAFYYSASNTAGTITLSGGSSVAWSDQTSGLLTTSNAYSARLVAGGFRITNLLSLAGNTPASGRLIVAPVSNVQYFSTGSFTESALRKIPGCMVIPLAALAASHLPVIGVTRPLDPSAFCYLPVNRSFSGVANDDPQFTSFLWMVVGAPASTTILECETAAHWEVLPVLTNAVLTTAGTTSSYSTLERAFNWAQENSPLTWDNAYTFADYAQTAFGYVPNPLRLQN